MFRHGRRSREVHSKVVRSLRFVRRLGRSTTSIPGPTGWLRRDTGKTYKESRSLALAYIEAFILFTFSLCEIVTSNAPSFRPNQV